MRDTILAINSIAVGFNAAVVLSGGRAPATFFILGTNLAVLVSIILTGFGK